MELIEPLINYRHGMSLRTTDKKLYWSRIGDHAVHASKEFRDPYTSFTVRKSPSSFNKIALQADNGNFVSLIGAPPRDVWCSKPEESLDDWCWFTVHNNGDGSISLEGHDGRFIKRWGTVGLKAEKEAIDQYSKFYPGYGGLIDPKFEIINVKLGPVSDVTYRPDSVNQDEVTNETSLPVDEKMTVAWKHEEVQTTTWDTMFGFNATAGFTVGIKDVNETNFAVSISYNFNKGHTSSQTNAVSFERSVKVKVPPGKKSIVKLIARRSNNVTVPFTATIREWDGTGGHRDFTEKGTWSGAYYNSAIAEVSEEDATM